MLTQAIGSLSAAAAAGLVGALLLGGTVKGCIGIGLPLVLVPLTTQFLDVPVAVGLLTVPMIATNIGQAMEGGGTPAAIRRLLPLLVPLVAGTAIGAHLLLAIDRKRLNAVLGVTFLALAVLLLAAPRVRVSPAADRWARPVVGFLAGLLGGVSAMFGPPVVAYLVGLGTVPAAFVKSMAIVAFTASLTLLLALGSAGSLTPMDLVVSAAAMLPILAGMPIGRHLRGRIEPSLFRALVLTVLACGGLDMLRRSLM